MFPAPKQILFSSPAHAVGVVGWVCALVLLAHGAQAADPASRSRRSRPIGIDTRFGDLIHAARDQQAAKNFARAVALYNEAAQMKPDPKNAAMLYGERGSANLYAGNHAAALTDYDKARQLQPGEALLHNDAAWLRATSPNPAVRNGKLAVQQAVRACELTKWKNADVIDTLGAAYAEAGQFDRAVQYQKQAISLTPLAERTKMQQRLRLFEQRMPYRLKGSGR